METRRFDTVIKALGTAVTRRRILRGGGVGLVGGVITWHHRREAAAQFLCEISLEQCLVCCSGAEKSVRGRCTALCRRRFRSGQ